MTKRSRFTAFILTAALSLSSCADSGELEMLRSENDELKKEFSQMKEEILNDIAQASDTTAAQTTASAETSAPETPASEETTTEQVPAAETTTTAPAAATLETETYSCEEFTMTIPKGWQVHSYPYNSGSDIYRLVLFITDPADTNNRIFYISAMEPVFDSQAQKSAWTAYFPQYNSCPVLSEMTAEQLLLNWSSIYSTYTSSSSFGFEKMLSNYTVQTVDNSVIFDGATESNISSEVVCDVAIAGSDHLYGLDYFCTMVKMDTGNGNMPYYTVQNNVAVCVRDDVAEAYFMTMADCVGTINLDGFHKKYNTN